MAKHKGKKQEEIKGRPRYKHKTKMLIQILLNLLHMLFKQSNNTNKRLKKQMWKEKANYTLQPGAGGNH